MGFIRHPIATFKAKALDQDNAIKGIPANWQHYLLCVLFHLLLPLSPLFVELVALGYIKTSTLAITGTVWSIGIAVSATNILEFGFYILEGVALAVVFGYTVVMSDVNGELDHGWGRTKLWILVPLGITFAVHAASRYNRHVIYKMPYFEFAKKEVE